jgi:hypothetical protein
VIARPPVAGVADREQAPRRRSASPASSGPAVTAAGSAAAGGQPLLPSVRPRLERVFGVDLGGVRVHTDTEAADLTRQAAAKAMTVGMDIYIAPGERDTDLELIAHEVAHVVQQQRLPAVQFAGGQRDDSSEREAQRAATAAVRNEPVEVREQAAGPRAQRLGLSDVLDYFADKANYIPGYRMFTIILGINPINMSRVERSAANILRALIEFMPGGALITQALDNHGVFDKAGAFVDAQVKAVGLSGSAIKQSISDFIDSLGWRDIFHLGSVWDRAKRIFTDPITKLFQLAKNVVIGIVTLIKDAILRPLAKLAEGTRAWDLLIAVLGKNPITGDPVPRNATTLIGGFMKLIGQQEVWSNMQKSNAVGRAWTWFQSTIAQLIAFVASIPSMAINAFKSLEIMDIVVLPRAFIKVGKVFLNFVGSFISWGLNAVWKLLEIVFDVVSPTAWGYVKKTGAALKSILKNPLPFVGNLARAGKLGFQFFKTNFVEHLKRGLIDWLTGSLPGVYIPKAFSLPEIVKFALSVLGISWANVRAKLVKVVGETAVKAMETGFEIVVILVRDGPAAAWDKIKSELSNLKDTVVDGIIDFVVDAVVKKAIPKFIAMFIPGAGFISAIISIYDLVMVFVQKISKIIQVVTAFVNSIVAIAAGQVDAAAKRVESVLAGLLSLAISFLAGFAGLGKVADKVMGVLNKVRAMIDKGIDKLIEWIVAAARKLGRFVAQAGVPSDPNERLRLGLSAATSAVDALRGSWITAGLIDPLLGAIKVRYGLKSLVPVEVGGDWWIEAQINPGGRRKTNKKAGSQPTPKPFTPQVKIDFGCSAKYDLSEYQEQLDGQAAGLNELPVDKWHKNRKDYLAKGRPAEAAALQEEARQDLRDQLKVQGKSKAEIDAALLKLAALHEPDLVAGGRITIKKLGSRFINSSIGSQWRTKVQDLDDAVRAIPTAKRSEYLMNVKLKAVPR